MAPVSSSFSPTRLSLNPTASFLLQFYFGIVSLTVAFSSAVLQVLAAASAWHIATRPTGLTERKSTSPTNEREGGEGEREREREREREITV